MTNDQRRDAVLYAILDHAESFGFGDVDPMLILAQSALETDNFGSRRIIEDRNGFGMKMPAQRPTVATGPGPGGFALYDSLEDSTIDYFMRQRYFGVHGIAPGEYIASTMAPPYPYAQEGQSYIDAWVAKYAGTNPDDVAWTTTLDPVIIEGTTTNNAGSMWIGALLVGYALSQ